MKNLLNNICYYISYPLRFYFQERVSLYKELLLIIEWFDSVGVFVQVEILAKNIFSFRIEYDKVIDCDDVFTKRSEATKQAIIKANEIYNSKTE